MPKDYSKVKDPTLKYRGWGTQSHFKNDRPGHPSKKRKG